MKVRAGCGIILKDWNTVARQVYDRSADCRAPVALKLQWLAFVGCCASPGGLRLKASRYPGRGDTYLIDPALH
jgi:hypothetical protein